jgi:very-short-patch-repair endonuclease
MAKLSGNEEYPIYFGAKPESLRIAAELRKNLTPAENILWNKLRNRQVLGYRFRRQHPISEVVVDFFCYEAKLVIEVDGEVHSTPYQKERDIERTNILKSFGLKEIRFRNEDVMNNIAIVLNKIERELRKY